MPGPVSVFTSIPLLVSSGRSGDQGRWNGRRPLVNLATSRPSGGASATRSDQMVEDHLSLGSSHRIVCRTKNICPFLENSTALSRSEEHTSELQSQSNLVCRLLLEKK